MNFIFKTTTKIRSDQFECLIQVIQDDEEIKNRIIQLLKLDSYQRRNVLNRWLEQLRREDALEKLRQPLSCLFDDDIADKTLLILKTIERSK
ncbi:MAG: hypothetical protein ACW99Q_23260 [Candidatus Kariarchaeaceae archaeon]|jgi:hypothetical protein